MAARRRSRQVETLLEPTLKTESEHLTPLMQFFALHRMATPYNVLDAFPQFFKQHKYVMLHLNWLANQGWLRRHGDKRSGYTYNITNTGYERCRDTDIGVELNRIPYKYQEPTGKQVQHELLITKTAVSLYQCVREQPEIRILAEGRFALGNIVVIDQDTGEDLRPFEHLVPDYFYLSRDRNGLMFRLVEVVRGVESVTDIRGMIAQYEQWEQTRVARQFLTGLYRQWGAKQPQPEYQLHCILESSSWKHTDAWKERVTMMQTFHVHPVTQGRVWTTTKEALETALAEGVTINHAIWRRGKDLLGERRRRFAQAPDGTRTRLVDQFIRNLPMHPLFA